MMTRLMNRSVDPDDASLRAALTCFVDIKLPAEILSFFHQQTDFLIWQRDRVQAVEGGADGVQRRGVFTCRHLLIDAARGLSIEHECLLSHPPGLAHLAALRRP
jgi:hypothetical protein